jgi:hypothetical protein
MEERPAGKEQPVVSAGQQLGLLVFAARSSLPGRICRDDDIDDIEWSDDK